MTTGTGTTRAIRVVVSDDQAIVRDGLVTVLSLQPDIEVVGEAADGAEAITVVTATSPDVVLMDLNMPGISGVEATHRILAEVPGTSVLVLTTYADDSSVVAALRAGAKGFLTKDADRRQVLDAVRAVANGAALYSAEVGRLLVDVLSRTDVGNARAVQRFPELTGREAEVLDLVGQGLSNTEIAARLVVEVSTVKTHINTIFRKLDVRDRAQAIAKVRSTTP